MTRLMSVSHTTEQVRNRTKTVTRRKGWQFLKPGDRLTLCEKVMGRRHQCATCDGLGVIDLTEADYDLIDPLAGIAQQDIDANNAEDCADCGGLGYVTDPLVRICDVEVVSAWREELRDITDADVAAEGFPDWSKLEFVGFFCDTFGGDRAQMVTRIEFRYLDGGDL